MALCPELERLEARQIQIRDKMRLLGLTSEQLAELAAAEKMAIMDIKEHEASGHDGEPCPGDR